MVSIILLNWNGARFLVDCLQSIAAQSYREFELLVVDNASTDGSQEILLREQERYRYQLVLNERNLGYCGGANAGIKTSRGTYVLIVNPDVILEPDFLDCLITCAEREPDVGILTGKLLRFDRRTLDSTGQFLRPDLSPFERGYDLPDVGQYDYSGPIFSACGAVVCYRRAMLEDIRLQGEYFDESYFAFYEDMDIGWRAQIFGWAAYYVATATAYHYRGGGLSKQARRKQWFERIPGIPAVSFVQKPLFIQRHIILNRYLTLLKNASWRDIASGWTAILKFDALLWGYVFCARPALLKTVLDFCALLPATLKKRREIQRRRVISAAQLRCKAVFRE